MGIRQVDFSTTMIGESHLQLFYMLALESLEERERQWGAFQADPEWQRVLANSEKDGIIVASAANSILVPTKFSALQ